MYYDALLKWGTHRNIRLFFERGVQWVQYQIGIHCQYKKNPFHSNPPPKKNGAHQTLFVKAETASTRRSTASLHTRHQKFRPHHPSNKKGKLHSFFWQLNNSPPRLFIVSMSRQSGMLAASLLQSLLHPIPIPTDDIFIVCENAILFRKTP